jgi:hypothetical protein
MIEDLLPSVCWSLIGFLIGWLVGREMLFISQIREAVVPEEERERTDQMVADTPERRSRLLGFVVVILAVFTVLQGSYFTYESNKKAQCQAQFNEDFRVVLQKRAQWADEDKQALTKLLSDLLVAKQNTGRTVLEDYLAATARNDKLRKENPLPKLEDRDC